MSKTEIDSGKNSILLLISWAVLFISLTWFVKSNFDFEPLIGVLTGSAGLLSFYSINDNWEKSKFSKWIENYKNSKLSPDKILDILFSNDFEVFKKKVSSLGYKQIGWEGEGGLNLFNFELPNGKNEQFYFYRTNSRFQEKASINISCVSNKLKLRQGIKRKLNNLTTKNILKLIFEKDENSQKIYKYDLVTPPSLHSRDGSSKVETKISLELVEELYSDEFTLRSRVEW